MLTGIATLGIGENDGEPALCLNPEEFLRKYVIPTISRKDPTFQVNSTGEVTYGEPLAAWSMKMPVSVGAKSP